MTKIGVILERRFVPKGQDVVREGERGNCAYLIQSGVVEVYTTDQTGHDVVLSQLEVGDIFGEMALLFDEVRTASVRALKDCNLIVISRKTFEQKIRKTDPTIQAIMKMFTQRLISANQALVSQKNDTDGLVDMVEQLAQQVEMKAPPKHKKAFGKDVRPKLAQAVSAIRAFQERYEQES